MDDNLHRTLICSVLFLDIEAYSKRSISEQLALKEQFNAILAEALQHVLPKNRIVLDTGDGAAVSFLSEPEEALFAALNFRNAVAALPPDQTPPLHVRAGINLGPVRLLKDLNGQMNIIGDGINDAQRIMSFAEPGSILVSRSYYDVVSRLTDDIAKLFLYEGVRKDKHVREHSVYAVGDAVPAMTQPVKQIPDPDVRTMTPSQGALPPTAAPLRHRSRTIGIVAAVVVLVAGVGATAFWLGRSPAATMPERPTEVAEEKKPAEGKRPPKPAPTPQKSTAATPQPSGAQPLKAKGVPAWVVDMRKELAACSGVFCKEQVRWKYCPKSNWSTYEECIVNK